MIFVTVGNHTQGFDRLIRQIDNLAPEIKEKIIIQKGYTKYIPKNCEYFDFSPNLENYYKKARIVICHTGVGTLIELLLKYKIPIITIPRTQKFGEHINDHQIGTAQYFEKRTKIRAIYDLNELTPSLIKRYKVLAKYDDSNLKRIRAFFKKTLNSI